MTELLTGTITRRTKGFYYLNSDNGEEVECKIKGQLFKESRFDNQAAVGDRVRYQKTEADDVGLIIKIAPRRSFLSRSRVGKAAEQVIAANVDYLLIVASTCRPAFRSNLVCRMLVAAAVGDITPVLVITKTDLATTEETDRLAEPFRTLDLLVVPSSTKTGQPDARLGDILNNHVSVLSGQSGVGKSSLLNRYFPFLSIRIGDVSHKTQKGAHTTTDSVMHQVSDQGFVIDTPGIREFGLWDVTQANLADVFPLLQDFRHQCRHRNCRHIHEPGCAVKEAVAAAAIHPVIYDGYVSIFNSLSPS